jgi:NDP-sugar pyrophosphorylase family protein
MKAILLIGGMGTRLRPLTLTTPKPLLPIENRPFLAYQLEFLHRYGFREIILCTSYRSEAFHKALGDGSRYGVKLHYVHESSPLGTGGAIKNAETHVDNTVLVCNGDILMDLNLKELLDFHRQKKALATIALTHVEDPTAYGVIQTDTEGRIHQFIEKPAPEEVVSHLINAGVYVFEKEVFALIPQGMVCSVERDIFPQMLTRKDPLFGIHLPGYWLDVGTLEKYHQAQQDVRDRRYPYHPALKRSAKKVKSRKATVR